MTYVDPMIPRMSPPQLKALISQASNLIAESYGPEGIRSHLAHVALNLPAARPRMAEIASLVAERYGLTLMQLRGPSRSYRIAHPRQEAFALIREYTKLSYPQIAAYFGLDHTTVMYGEKAHKARVAAAMSVAAE